MYICQNDWTKPGYRLTIRTRITAKALYFAMHESKHSITCTVLVQSLHNLPAIDVIKLRTNQNRSF